MTTVLYNIGHDIYSYFLSDKTVKEGQLLEPLSCIIKLGILHLKTVGTKLRIIDNSIKFQDPDVLQGSYRWLNGDNRDDLHNLCNPIQIALEWYDPNSSQSLNYLYTQALEGLKILSKSYDTENVSSLIANTIAHYTILIENSMANKNKECKSNEDNIYKNLWTDKEIDIVKNILELAIIRRNNKKIYEKYLLSIESILDDKDEQIRQIIYKNKTKI